MTKRFWMLTLLASSAVLSISVAAPVSADVVATCAGCHGTEGTSSDKDLAIIGGMSAKYISGTLDKYKSGDRKGCPEFTVTSGDKKGTKTDMCQVAKTLSDADIAAAADHYAAKPFVRAQQTVDAALADKGKAIHKESCEKCHTEGGSVKADDAGMLAGQWMPYLAAQIADFRSKKRMAADKMQPKVEKLSQAEIDAVLQYYGSFK